MRITSKILETAWVGTCFVAWTTWINRGLVNFCRSIPDGILIFFPSYALLESCIEGWKKSKPNSDSVWNRINQHKRAFVEPREKSEFLRVSLIAFVRIIRVHLFVR